MSNPIEQLNIPLPPWLIQYQDSYHCSTDPIDQMRFVIRAAELNIRKCTGGPFGAGVFHCDTGELLALGVNLVETLGLSILHAEIVALSFAQRQIENFDLSNDDKNQFQLVCSSEPCAMCLGAIPWSGVRKIYCGATINDARAIGFDEGAIPPNWQQELLTRNITIETKLLHEEAQVVLALYKQLGGNIYNSNTNQTTTPDQFK